MGEQLLHPHHHWRASSKVPLWPYLQVVVVASPANTNALVLHYHAPSIPAHNITCLSRLDHNRTVAQVR